MSHAKQATFDRWTPDRVAMPFDSYGPTARHPLPESETLEDWKRRINYHGFNWQVLRDESFHGGLPEYHIDDADRQRERHVEADQRAFVAAEERRP